MIETQKINGDCYILGAGFSAPCGIPPGNDLFLRIKDINNEIWENRILPYAQFLNYDFNDPEFYYEDLLSDLDSEIKFFKRLSAQDPGEYSRKQLEELDRVKWAIRAEILSVLFSSQKRSNSSKNMEELIEASKEGKGHIISFNYDFCLEKALEAMNISPKFCGAQTIKDPYICISKLHGSLNWFMKEPPDYHKQFAERVLDSYVLTSYSHDPYIVNAGVGDDENYNLIYPSIFKDIAGHELLIKSWSEAFLRLAYCKNIYFMGYSLPDGDWLTKSLLIRSFRGPNENPQNVFVLDKCFNDQQSEYSTKMMRRFRRIYGTRAQFYYREFDQGLNLPQP